MAITHNSYIFRNFINETECDILSDWILRNYETKIFSDPKHPGTIRRSTRFSSYPIEYPILSYDIQKRLDEKISEIFKNKKIEKIPSFFDGMYASYGFVGDKCERHTDPVYIPNTITYHCNLILTEHQGGQLILDGVEYILNKKDVIFYPVSLIPHETTKLVGEKARMFWNFGYCVYE